MDVWAGKRVALVIGNADYAVGRLPNPANDAKDIAKALGQLQFDSVDQQLDIKNRRAQDETIRSFAGKASGAELALIFYAGHAVQVDGHNYLIPTQADIRKADDLKYDATDLSFVLDNLGSESGRVNLVILDACRDNPYPKDSRSGADRGLARIEAPSATLIAYATSPGATAKDGEGRNSPYTQQLLAHFKTPGLSVLSFFNQVAGAVEQNTQGRQSPRIENSYVPQLCLTGDCAQASVALPPVATQLVDPEQRLWDDIKNSQNVANFQAYLKQFPSGLHADFARIKIEELMPKPAVAAQVVTTPPVPTLNSVSVPSANPAPVSVSGNAYGIDMVRLPSGIAMGKYEVTQGQWRAVMGNNPSNFASCGDNCPVEQVSWDDVQQFIQRLNSQTGQRYRLPSEDEWFAACQAGYGHEYCGSNSVDAVAWYGGNSGNRMHPVGQKQPNAWGLYDMSGNVWEWTSSCYEGDCSRRVYRGGSWTYLPALVRSADRYWSSPSLRFNSLGFRLAQDD